MVAFILFVATSVLAREIPNVLIINSYAQGYQWSDDELSGVMAALSEKYENIEPVIVHLDTRRFPDSARLDGLLNDIRGKCLVAPPKLIITLDNAAFDFLIAHRAELGASVPVVFGGLNRFTPGMIARVPLITGVSEETRYGGTFRMIASLCPDIDSILVITNSSPSAKQSRAAFEDATVPLRGKYHFEYYDSWTNEELISRVSTLRKNWAGLILDATQDSQGHANYNDAHFSLHLSSRASVPIFINSHPPGRHDWSVLPWDGIGGGLVVAELHGRKVGELAVRVLEGESPDQIPVVRTTPELLAVDYRQLLRHQIPVSAVPEGTVIYNLPDNFYRIHRVQIVVAAGLFIVLSSAVVLLSVNIVRRRRAEHLLRAAQHELSLLARVVEESRDMVLILQADGLIYYANPATLPVCSRVEKSLRGLPFDSVFGSRAGIAPVAVLMDEASSRGNWKGQMEFHLNEGGRLLLHAALAPMHAGDSQPLLYFFIGHDVTREQRLEDQLRSSQKMEAIGLLAGGVAHDFNNIVQLIQGHTALLLEELRDSAHAEDLREIHAASMRAARLTRQLLLFSRHHELSREVFDANTLIEETLGMIRRLIGEHIALQFVPLSIPAVIRADRGHLEQVLLNLCVNARDAMPQGGRLVITLGMKELSETDCEANPGMSPGRFLELAVQDTGCGMPPSVRARIFDPFFTTKPVGKGTGLGLSVVYGIMQAHKGTIRVYSEPGHGTAFRLYFPFSDEALPQPSLEDVAPVTKGQGLVLVAEDDKSVQALARRVLERNGFEVMTADDGVLALAAIHEHHDRLRLVMLDVLMPKLYGVQVYEEMRGKYPDIPVLFCSGYSADMLPSGMAPEKGTALITKPYASRDLLEAIHQLVDRPVR